MMYLQTGVLAIKKTPPSSDNDNVQRVDNARQVAQTGEYDIDQQVAAAAPLEEHADGGREDGEDDFADVAVC